MDAGDAVAFVDEIVDQGLHLEMEGWKPPAMPGEKEV